MGYFSKRICHAALSAILTFSCLPSVARYNGTVEQIAAQFSCPGPTPSPRKVTGSPEHPANARAYNLSGSGYQIRIGFNPKFTVNAQAGQQAMQRCFSSGQTLKVADLPQASVTLFWDRSAPKTQAIKVGAGGGPARTNWPSEALSKCGLLAHELLHNAGLYDEYYGYGQNGKSNRGCSRTRASIMNNTGTQAAHNNRMGLLSDQFYYIAFPGCKKLNSVYVHCFHNCMSDPGQCRGQQQMNGQNRLAGNTSGQPANQQAAGQPAAGGTPPGQDKSEADGKETPIDKAEDERLNAQCQDALKKRQDFESSPGDAEEKQRVLDAGAYDIPAECKRTGKGYYVLKPDPESKAVRTTENQAGDVVSLRGENSANPNLSGSTTPTHLQNRSASHSVGEATNPSSLPLQHRQNPTSHQRLPSSGQIPPQNAMTAKKTRRHPQVDHRRHRPLFESMHQIFANKCMDESVECNDYELMWHQKKNSQ